MVLEKPTWLLFEVQAGQQRILEIELFNLVAPAAMAGSSLTGTQVQQYRVVVKKCGFATFLCQ